MKKIQLIATFLLSSIVIFGSIRTHAQGGGSKKSNITGVIVDTEGNPIPYAAVSVSRTSDSTIVAGSATDFEGNFSVAIDPGNYMVSFSFLSFKNRTINNVNVVDNDVQLGKIKLESSSEELDAVTLTAERTQMELKLDKRVFNVSKDLSNTASNATEILDNLPSVEVDVDGNVSLRGSGNVRILIDGKPSGLVGMSGSDALRHLQGSMIEKVEVITNPSARYDAEGEVGIINIVLKKEKQKGLNGTFDVNAGYPDNHGLGYSLNYRKEKVNFFSSLGLNYRKNPGFGENNQEFFNSTDFTYLESDRDHERGGISGNFRMGAEYYLNQYNSVAVSGLYQKSSNDNFAKLKYNYLDSNRTSIERVERDEDEIENTDVVEGNINYIKTFKKKDRKWTTDLKYVLDVDLEDAELTEQSNATDVLPLYQRTSNTENEINWLVQSDYVHPFGKEGMLEGGVKATLRDIENDFLLEEKTASDQFEPVSAFDNELNYIENIYAAYFMGGNKVKKFSYQLGLRWEYSDVTTKLVKTNEVNHREYHNLFPSTHFSYEVNKKNSVQISYSRRISRPRFRHLLPFYGYSDSRNFYSGNPNLQPEFSNSTELGHLKYWDKGTLLTSVYYRYTTGVVERITVSDSAGTTRSFPINLSTQDAVGLEFNYSYTIKKWWKVNTSFNFYRAIRNGEYEGKSYNADTYTWNSTGNTKFSLNKLTDFQISYNYRAPRINTQGRDKSMYSIDLGLSRDVLKGKGTLSFNARDIFNTRKRRSITETDQFYSESEFQWRSRQFRINFNYRLKTKKPNRKNNGSGDFGDDDM